MACLPDTGPASRGEWLLRLVTLSALLDGMAVRIALEHADAPPARPYELAMRYAAGQLGFNWNS